MQSGQEEKISWAAKKRLLIDLIIPHKSIIENIRASINPTNKKIFYWF